MVFLETSMAPGEKKATPSAGAGHGRRAEEEERKRTVGSW